MLGGLSEGMGMAVEDEMMGCWEEGWEEGAVRSGNGGTGLVRVMRQWLFFFLVHSFLLPSGSLGGEIGNVLVSFRCMAV